METKYLATALAVARHASFTLAAQELYMSQSTISRQIQSLERELGEPLFARRVGAVEPTPFGKRFLRRAERILREVHDVQRARAEHDGR